jgi:hypothetical protein
MARRTANARTFGCRSTRALRCHELHDYAPSSPYALIRICRGRHGALASWSATSAGRGYQTGWLQNRCVDHETQRTALTIARSAERWSYWRPGDWPGLAVEMLVVAVVTTRSPNLPVCRPPLQAGTPKHWSPASTRSTTCRPTALRTPSHCLRNSWLPWRRRPADGPLANYLRGAE